MASFRWQSVKRWRGPIAVVAALGIATGATIVIVSGGPSAAPRGSVPGQASVPTPRQATGTAAGRSHLVSASATAARRLSAASGGTSRPPQPPAGTVAAQRFNVPHSSADWGLPPPRPRPVPSRAPAGSSKPHGTAVKVSGFNPKTSKLLSASVGRANARVYQNSDGTRTADVYQHPVNYRTASGSWDPINTTLVRAGAYRPAGLASAAAAAPSDSARTGPPANWQVTANTEPETFANTGTGANLAVLGFSGDTSVGFGVGGAAQVTARVSGSTVTYRGIRPDANLQLTVLAGGGAKESIVLQSASAPAVWTFPLDLKGVTPSVDATGRVVFTDAAGNVVAWFPHAFMTDSDIGAHSDIGAYSDAVTYQLSRNASGTWLLTMRLDSSWLDDPARVFPVTVDPTALWNYADTQDTFVQTGYSTTNDTSAELRIGTYDGGSDYAATYLNFSALSNELSNDTIYGATLYLDEIWSFSCTAEPVGVYKVTQSWSAGNIANYPGPSYDSTALGTAKFATGYTTNGSDGCPNPAWEHIDLGSAGTTLVQSWANGGNNYGLTVRAPTSGQTSCSSSYPTSDCGWKKFDSDNAADGLNTAYLAVTYSPYGANYAFAASPPTVSPAVSYNQAGYVNVKVTNEGHDTWTPTNGYYLTFDAYESDGKTSACLASASNPSTCAAPDETAMPSNVAPGQTVTVKAKINAMAPGSYVLDFDMIYVTSSGYALFSDWGVPRTADLDLTVNAYPPTLNEMYPANNYQVDTLTPELFADGTTVDAWPTSTLQYNFTVCAGAPWPYDTWCNSSSWQTSRIFQIPASWGVTWDTDYYWTVSVSDSGGYGTQPSTAGPVYLLQTAVQAPVVTSHLAAGDEANGTLNPVMGNYSTTVTDASVSTAGPALAITRTYNSLDPRTSAMFGAGWSTIYDMAVTPDGGGTGSVVVTMADGTQMRFGQNADGSYSPQQGLFATLSAVSGGGWQLMDKSSTVYTFNSAGQLTSIADNRGRTETLTYTGSQLTTINSASGRALHLTWSGGHVASVATDPVNGSALTWTYSYSGTELTQVCTPAAAPNCTSYSYTAGSHLGTKILDADAVGYWPLSETSGTTAVSGIGANLGTDDGTYYGPAPTLGQDAGPGAGSGVTAAGFSGGTRIGLPNYSLTKLGPFLTASAWFKTTSDGVILEYQDTSLSSGNPNHWTPALYVGTNGKLYAEFWQGTMAPIASAGTVNDGKWHLAVLSGDGSSQTLYLDGQKVGTLSGTILGPTQDVTYVGDGYSSNWTGAPSGGGYFAFTGDIADVGLYDYPLGQAQVTEQYQAAQSSAELSQVTLPSGRVQAKLSYNTAADRVATETDAQGGAWTLGGLSYSGSVGTPTATAKLTDPRSGVITSQYDPLRSYQMTSQTDQAGGTTTWGYNTAGFVDSKTDPDGDQTDYYLDARGNITGVSTERTSGTWYTSWNTYYLDSSNQFDPRNDQMTSSADGRSASSSDTTYQTTWAYDSYGDVTSEHLPATPGFSSGRNETWSYTAGTESAVGGGTEPPGLLASYTDTAFLVTTYAYDSAGDLMQETDPNGLVTKYTYDALGRETSKTEISADFPNGITTTYTYDALSQPLTQTGPATANLVSGLVHTQRTTYTYDPDGNVLTTTVSDTTGGDAARVTTNVYNSYGELSKTTDPTGAVTSYTYDAAGNIATVTDADGNVYAYTYTPTSQVATKSLENWTGNPYSPSPAATLVLDSYAYDPAGRLASVTDSMGRTTSYTYFMDGLQATIAATGVRLNGSTSPANVVVQSYTYDGAGNPTQDVANGGLSTTNYTWDAGDRLQSQTLDPSGLDRVTSYAWGYRDLVTSITTTGAGSTGSRVTLYGYDNASNLTSQTVEDGAQNLTTTYTFDALGNLTSITDPRGNVSGANAASYTTTMTYDAAGDVQAVTDPPVSVTSGGSAPATTQPVITYGYDTFGDKTQAENPLAQVTSYAFDGDGRLTKTTAPVYTPPGGSAITPVTVQSYDGNGNLTSVTDPDGNTTTYSYDQLSDKVRVTDPAVNGTSGQWNYAYDTDGEQTAAVSPTGAQTQYTYDDLGRQITATQVERYPSNAAYTTAMTYDDAGNLVSSTNPLGNTTSYAYDAASDLTKQTDPAGDVTSYGYDAWGDPASVTNPLGDVTSYGYDQAGRETSMAQANSSGTTLATTSYGYDPAGNQTSVTNPDANTTTSAYNALNQLASVTTPVTSTASDAVSYGYDAAGNRTMVTDGNGNSTVATYNSLGLPGSVILPATSAYPSAASRTYTVSYDADGRTVSESEPGGISRAWTYNALGDLTGQSGSGASASTAARTLGYNQSGQLTSYSSPGGTVSLSYDDRGLPLSVTGGGQPAQSYAYNAAGQLTSRTDAAGAATFGYDQAGRLGSMTDPLTGANITYGYNQASELTGMSYGSGNASQALGYDALGRVTSDTLQTSAAATIASATYGYDAAGNLTSQTTTGTAGAGTSAYTYDQAGWLTSWKSPAGTTTSYGYDKAGNLTSAGSATYSYDQQDQLTSAVGSAGTTTYSYAPSGTLSQISGPSGSTSYSFDAYGDMATAGSISYGYDALGRLTQRTGSTGTTTLAYDGTASLTPAAILGSSGQVQQGYDRDPAGNLVAASVGGAAAIAWTDPLHGDVTGLLAPSAASLESSAAYDPWGNVTATSGSMPALGYQGGYTDSTTGLVDMGSRWYNPATGGFTSADTLATVPGPGGGSAATAGDPVAGDGPGPYGYAGDNPLTIMDLTGHWAPSPGYVPPPTDVGPLSILTDTSEIAGGEILAGGGPEDPFADAVAAGTFIVGGAIALFSWASSSSSGGGYNPYADLANLPNLSGLSGINFSDLPNLSGLSGIDFSGLPNLSGLAGLNLPFLGGINWAAAAAGGCSLACILAQLPPPCDVACHQAQHVLDNENKVLAKPHENPAITQAELNKQREAVEARVKRQVASENASRYQQQYAKSRAALAKEQAAKFDMPVGSGGPPGGGLNYPTANGCDEEPPSSTNDPGFITGLNDLFTSTGDAINWGAKIFQHTTPTVGVSNLSYYAAQVAPLPDPSAALPAVVVSAVAIYKVIQRYFKNRSGGGSGGPQCPG
jgi:RHS repeat-associated protein